MQTFDRWISHINWMLKQETEYGDFDSADRFARLDEDEAMTVLNRALDYLAMQCEERFKRVVEITVPSSGYELKLSSNFARINGIMLSGGTDFTTIANSSDVNSAIRKLSDDTIWNDDGWTQGDRVKVSGVIFPEHVEDTNDVIDFPRGFMELLDLEVIKTVKYQSDQSMPQLMWATYQRLAYEWMNSSGRMRETAVIRLKRKGIGA